MNLCPKCVDNNGVGVPTGGEELRLWVSDADGGTGGIAICGGPQRPTPTLSYRGSE